MRPDPTELPQFQPKGSMCMSCVMRGDDCSYLDFSKMPVLFVGPPTIVRCTEHTPIPKETKMPKMINQTIQTQNAEFDAVRDLSKEYQRIEQTPIVDDDYPMVRADYEAAMLRLIEALRANGRL